MNLIIDAVGIRTGGAASILRELLHWIPRARPSWNFHAIVLRREHREFDLPKYSDISVEETSEGRFSSTRLFWVNIGLPKRVKLLKADRLLCLANLAPLYASIDQVLFCHQITPFQRDKRFSLSLKTRLLRHSILGSARSSRSVIVQTSHFKDQLVSYGRLDTQKVFVIPSGVNSQPAGHIRPEKRAMVDRCPEPRLIYVSHPGKHKNHQTLIRALPIIKRFFPSVSLMLTMDGNNAPSRLYAECVTRVQTIARACGVTNNIVYTGQLTASEVAYALQASSLMVYPSESESFGLPLAEAMAAGCPVVASDLEYAREVAGAAMIGFEPTSPEALAAAVLQVLRKPALRQKLRTEGRRIGARYDYSRIAETFVQVIQGEGNGVSSDDRLSSVCI